MKLFLDTANLHQIKELESLNIINGVTTNPSLMAKEEIRGPKNWTKHYSTICSLVEGPVSAEVIATNYKNMLEEAYKLARLHNNIVVKIPMTKAGIQVISVLSKENIKTNCTLVFTAAQALLAAKAGATFVSPFVGRLDDIGLNGMNLISDICEIYSNYPNLNTEVLVASIRSPNHVIESAKIGADVVTLPANILKQLIHHPLTDNGLKAFLEDWKMTGQSIT